MSDRTKRILIQVLPYLLIALLCTNVGEAWRLAEGSDASAKVLGFLSNLGECFSTPWPSYQPFDLVVGLCCGAAMRLAVYLKGKNAKKYRHNEEYGSARWGNRKDIEPFADPDFFSNIILTRTEWLMMSNRPKNPVHARNKNVLVIGGSGSGKSRFFVRPNILQAHSSFVVTDPKSELLRDCGTFLVRQGYVVKFFNTIDFRCSMHYNPLVYVHSEKDILKLVTVLMTNTQGEGKSSDPFWEAAERLLFSALIAYIHYEAPTREQNFATLIELLNMMEVREEDESFQNQVDIAFEVLAQRKPDCFAVRQYRMFKLAAGVT